MNTRLRSWNCYDKKELFQFHNKKIFYKQRNLRYNFNISAYIKALSSILRTVIRKNGTSPIFVKKKKRTDCCLTFVGLIKVFRKYWTYTKISFIALVAFKTYLWISVNIIRRKIVHNFVFVFSVEYFLGLNSAGSNVIVNFPFSYLFKLG